MIKCEISASYLRTTWESCVSYVRDKCYPGETFDTETPVLVKKKAKEQFEWKHEVRLNDVT